jgi:adenine-specific DNA-methyltransferase
MKRKKRLLTSVTTSKNPQGKKEMIKKLKKLILSLLPTDGSTVGNTSLRRALEEALAAKGQQITEEDYWAAHAALMEEGFIATGKGRGGSVKLIKVAEDGFSLQAPMEKPADPAKPRTSKAGSVTRAASGGNDPAQIISYRHPDKRVNNPEVGMVNTATDPHEGKNQWAYDPHIDPALQFDPQRGAIEALIDDALASGDNQQMRDALEELKRLQSPYLNWTGKAERTSFEIDKVSLHVHERIDPASILAAVRKAMQGEGKSKGLEKAIQPGLFEAPFESLPLRDAIDFYRHERGWANRLIAGDSLLVMNSMLQKESMAGKVQMIYIDPPYGIKYGSNFQPFVGKRDVKDRSDADLTQEPEMIKAFRDTWELGIHSYLTYLRDRLLLAKDLLSETGSVFVQISDENLHHVRELCDEIFGLENFISVITVSKTTGSGMSFLDSVADYVVWYGKDKSKTKYNQQFTSKESMTGSNSNYRYLELSDGTRRPMTLEERTGRADLPVDSRIYRVDQLTSQTDATTTRYDLELCGEYFQSGKRQWATPLKGMERLIKNKRVMKFGSAAVYIRYLQDFSVVPIKNVWVDTSTGGFGDDKVYVVQTTSKVIERCLLMTTNPGDLVLDPTCGSGTTAFVAEKWGRRWITCDTSRVAVTLAKQRLMTSSFDYFELKYPHEGLKGGFIYKTVPHVTLKSIANNPDIDSIYERMHPAIVDALTGLNKALRKSKAPTFTPSDGARIGKAIDLVKDELHEWEVPFDFPEVWPEKAKQAFEAFHQARMAMQKQMDDSIAAHADQETLYDQPAVSKNRLRITGPFTVEAVPFPSVKSLDEASGPEEADSSIARTGESGRQHQWRDELIKTGIRGKGGQMLKFADLETLPYDASIRNLHAVGHLQTGERVVISFGPEYAALEQRQVESAKNEAGDLFPTPKMIVFCAFAFDPEAAKDIDGIKGITALKAQMNTDLLTEDLKKARSSNQSFWLMGQPEVEVRTRKDGQFEVEVHGFDYFDTVKGELVSGGKSKIAMWALDPDYDERSLFPRQVFFPQAGKGEGWEKLKKNIRTELDEDRLQKFQGTVSLPFEAGENRKIAVKIVDDRGIESLKVIPL